MQTWPWTRDRHNWAILRMAFDYEFQWDEGGIWERGWTSLTECLGSIEQRDIFRSPFPSWDAPHNYDQYGERWVLRTNLAFVGKLSRRNTIMKFSGKMRKRRSWGMYFSPLHSDCPWHMQDVMNFINQAFALGKSSYLICNSIWVRNFLLTCTDINRNHFDNFDCGVCTNCVTVE